LKGVQEFCPIVSDRGFPLHEEPNVFQLLTHVTEVGIDNLPRQHLIACADDLDSHGTPILTR
jgi:hypothetical protein